MKIAIVTICCVVLVAILAVGVGSLLPIGHQAVREAEFKRSPQDVWNLVSSFEAGATWRPDIKAVTKVQQGSDVLWREIDSHGDSILYKTMQSIPAERLVRKIVDDSLPFGGSWTFDLAATDDGCVLRITEDGEVYNPVFRFLSRFVFGHTATLDKYLAALRAKLQEPV